MDGSRCSLFPSESNRRSHTGSNGWDSCDKSVDFNVTPRVYSEPRCLRSSNEPNSLLGMYRGLANSKPKGLQHRRNRVSVDHLGGSRVRLRKGGGKSGKQDPRFQGSITVNQTAFLKRLLDLNLSPVHDDIVNYWGCSVVIEPAAAAAQLYKTFIVVRYEALCCKAMCCLIRFG